MQIVSSQPATHSLLRSSQARRQSQSSRVNQNTQSNNEQKRQQTKDKYHFNYDGSIEKKIHSNKVFVLAANCESQYVDKEVIRQRQNSLMRPKQEIVVCKSLPHSRPKYSFTFNNMVKQHQTGKINTNNNQSSQLNPQMQQKPPQSNNLSKDNQSQPQFHSPAAPHPFKQTPRSSNIRKDIDVCLYTITDKLRQLQQKQYPKQSSVRNSFIGSNGKQHEKQKNPIKQPVRESQMGQGYRPSLTQMRKNSRKMWMDNSIHRIQPEIVEEYIETVYRDYNIPNPISGQRQISERSHIQNQITILPFNTHGIGQQVIQHQQQEQQSQLNLNQSTNQQQIKQPVVSPKPCSPPNIQPIKPQLSHEKIPQSPKNRQNHLINKQKQNLKPQTKHRNRRSFLELTLSKDKTFKTKTFDSPPKRNRMDLKVQGQRQDQKQGPSKQLSKEKSENSRSRSRVRQSQSQRKVQEIKKNIAQWKDSEHQFAERYSYLQSPYQVIRQQNRTTPQQQVMNRSHQTQQTKGDRQHRQQQNNSYQSHPSQQINIKILPFQSLTTHPQTQPNQAYKQSTYSDKKHMTSHNNSTYHQSFYSSSGEVLEEFRYCLLCEAPVLSANIWLHERKCIGWISKQGKLYQFGQLYRECTEEEVKAVVRGKVEEIRSRIGKMIQDVRQREERSMREVGVNIRNDMKNDKKDNTNQSHQHKDNLSHSILTSVQSLINSFDLTQSHPSNLTHHHNLTQSFTRLHQTTRQNPYLTLLQQSNKFHWFIKLLQGYEQRLMKKATNAESSNRQKKKGFSSTKARNNLSMTLVQEQAQPPITQWSSKKPYN